MKNIWFIGIGIYLLYMAAKYFIKAASLNYFTTFLCSIVLFLISVSTLYQVPIVKNYDKTPNTCTSQHEAKQNDTNKV